MIHTLLPLNRSLFFLDTETTGTNPDTDRICELGFREWTAEGMVREWRSLIDPTVPIPPATSKKHGITDEMIKGCRSCQATPLDHPNSTCDAFKPHYTFRQIAPNLAKGFVNCDFGGQNVRFDLKIIAAEMKRALVPWNYNDAAIVDSGRLEQIVEPRSLSDLYKKYTGENLEGAHGALADVKGSEVVVCAQLRMHTVLPRDLRELHELQWPGRLDADGKFTIVEGVATCQFGKYRGRAMRSIPMDYYDWILKSEFPEDVKRLAADAKLGKFPGGQPQDG